MGVLERLFCTLRGDKPLVIRKINPFSVEIPSGFKELYGYKVLSGTERVLTLGEDTIEKISAFKGTEPNRYLYFVIARDREPKTGLFKTDIYMFGHEPAFLDLTAKTLGEKKFQKLKGYEIANILTNLAFVKNRLSITPQRKIIEMNNYFSEKDLGPTQEKSYNIMKELDWENIKVYWGGEYKGTQVDWDTVLSLPWTGVLYITIDVNDQSFSIKKKREKSIQDVKTFAEMQENIEKGTKDYVGVSIAFYTRDEDVEDYIINLFYALGFVPLKKNYGIEMLVRGTPLLYKDFDFFFQTTPLLAEQYGIYQFTKNVMPKEVGIYGMDRFGSYVAYNIFEENENAHCVIVAPPGSGKSVGIQKMVTTILKVDIEKLINGEAQDIENVRIRHIDKGFSAELFYKLLKLRGFKVDIMSPRPSEIAFNPCEIESEEDYEFSEQIINLCLEAIKQEPLKGFESSFYKRALKIAKESDIRKTYYSKTISSLNKIEPLKDVVQELYKRGYTDRDIIGEIKEPEFSFLLQPVLSDVYRVLNDWDISGLTKREREELDSLIAKINALLQEPMLNIPAKISFKNTQIFYMDYEFLRESKFFAPIMLTILKKLVRGDKYTKKADEKAYYFIDEVHNLYNYQGSGEVNYFEKALDILIREVRKFRISICMATQSFEEIPPTAFSNMATHMFIAPVEKSTRESFLNFYAKHLNITLKGSDLLHVYERARARAFIVKYSKGVFSLSMPVSQTELKVFSSYNRQLELPDGGVIRKSFVSGG